MTVKKSRAGLVCAVIMNLAVVVLSAAGTVMNCENTGAGALRFYTVDSNIFAAVGCLAIAAFSISELFGGRAAPAWAVMLKYMGVCCLSVTFLVVVFVLSPMFAASGASFGPTGSTGFLGSLGIMLFHGDMLYHHFLCPILAAASFFMFDKLPFPAKKCAMRAVIPTALYAAVAVVMNLLGVWHGPYPFLYVYEQPWWLSVVWAAVIVGGAFLIAWLAASPKTRKKEKV